MPKMNPVREEERRCDATGVENGELKRWETFLATARQMLSRNEFGKSMSHFAYVIHHAPELRDEIHDDFLFALKNWCDVLEQHGKVEDLVKCLNEARRLFPRSALVSNNVGSALFRLNLFDEAAAYFRRALVIDPGLSSARENLDSLANLLVERWHFRMLNDKARNQAYKNAIERAVGRGYGHVLDIGSGTGILSMYAVRAGAKQVHACEMSRTMFELSADVLAANGMRDSIHVINKKSCDLKIPDDVPTRVSLVVTETLDCGLLGEGILETLAHARRELVRVARERDTGVDSQDAQEPYGEGKACTKIIPEGATVYGRVVECEKIREYTCVKRTILDLDLGCVNIKGAEISEKCNEPYTTEEMSCVAHTPLSEPFHVVTYDFRTPEKYTTDRVRQIKVPVSKAGAADAVVTWFELKLDEFETISSAPGRSVCWEQAVYPVGVGNGESGVETGDEMVLRCRLTSGAIFIDVDHVVKAQSMGERKDQREKESCVLPFSEISKLNDVSFNESFRDAILGSFSEIHSGKHVESKNYGCLVLCDSPSFSPLFASAAGFSPVLCVTPETDFSNCLEALRADNRLPDTIRFTDSKLEEHTKSGRWGVLVVDPVEPSGVLRRQVVEDIVFAKGCVLPADTGIVLPRKIELWGMLISSDSLCRKGHVLDDDVTLGLDIARHMNTFQVKNQIDVDVSSNPYVALTQPVHLMTLDFMTSSSDDDVSPLSLLEVTRVVDVTADSPGDVDGLMYWFVMEFSHHRKFSTGPESSSHFNQVVVLFKEKLSVSLGETLSVTSSCKNSCVTASAQRS